jgi:ATP-dependent DNA helicase RecQ
LRAYRNHRIVRPLIDDHQSEEVWSTRVGPLRDDTYAAAGRSFQLMRAVLHGKRDVAEDIAELYRIPSNGTRRGVNVAESCGGCRACRENGIAPYETDAPAPWSAWKVRDEVGEALASEFGAQTVLALFHTGFEELRKERRLGQFIEWLAYQGIRNIVCPPVLHEPIRHRLRRFATPVFLFERYEPLYLQPFGTLVIITDRLQTEDLREVLHAQRNRVLLLPDSVRDPDAPHRRLQDVLSYRTYVFDDFLTRIGI